MLGRSGAEAVADEALAALQQPEIFMGHDQVAKAGHGADRAIAVEDLDRFGYFGLEPHRLAMTTTLDFHGSLMHHCFPPVTRPDTRLLVLGSLPGAVSLERQQYYAHKQNQFWRLIGAVIERDLVDLPYERRLEALLAAHVGLWDTVAAATRAGSLDADIRLHEASDLAALASTLPELRAIAFNGGTSARIGRRQLAGTEGFALIDLPSSSPAYASLPFARKRDAWRALRAYL